MKFHDWRERVETLAVLPFDHYIPPTIPHEHMPERRFMARVTVEDCVQLVPNRFKLVLLAGQRARALSMGADLTVERDDDKNPVIALREIADKTVGIDELEENILQGLQKHVEVEEDSPELEEMLGAEDAMIAAMTASELSGVDLEAEVTVVEPAAEEEAAASDAAGPSFADDIEALKE